MKFFYRLCVVTTFGGVAVLPADGVVVVGTDFCLSCTVVAVVSVTI